MKRFADRIDAGRRLARALAGYAGRGAVVLALPRGGVPVAEEVAHALKAPLDLLLVRKLGLPGEEELAMGAVVDGAQPIVVRNPDIIAMAGVDEAAFQAVCDRELQEIERRKARYIGDRPRAPIKDRVVIVVDDGIATGATVRAALSAVHARGPKELVLAVPVAPPDTVARLKGEVDTLVCLQTPEPFGAIGYFYDDFTQVNDEAVIAALARCPALPAGEGAAGAPEQS